MRIRNRRRLVGARLVRLAAALTAVALFAAACSSEEPTDDETGTEQEEQPADDESAPEEDESEEETDNSEDAAADALAWCGDTEVSIGIQDGIGLNAWSQESLAQVQAELAKCEAVVETSVVNAGFDPQQGIAGIQGFVAQGFDGLVIIPDAGVCAELTAMADATERGLVVVPWAADGCGEVGTDYAAYVDWDTVSAGRTWTEWVVEQMGGEGNLLFLGGPAGTTVTSNEIIGVLEVLEDYPDVTLLEPISESEWPVTNWDPAAGRQLMSSLLAEHDQIDGLIIDYGAVAEAALRAFEQAGREIPPLATTEGNGLSCVREELGANFEMATISSRNWLGRYAAQTAVALTSGGTAPQLVGDGVIPLGLYEDTTDADAQPLCDPDESPEKYFSNDLPDEVQDEIAIAGS